LRLRDKMPFHFIKLRRIWYAISAVIILAGIVSLATRGLNLGIDFTGGSLLDLSFNQPVTVQQVREVLGDFGLEGASIQQSGENTFLIRSRELSEAENNNLIQSLEEKIGEVNVRRSERVGPVIGRELIQKAVLALVAAAVLMIIYITWRFEFKQGIAAIVAVLHDVLVVLGVFSILQLEVNSAFVAAILTVIGYSINDTIVIFDRIRENVLYMKKGMAFEDVINASLWQTLARSINTVLTVEFILVALLVLGGATIQAMVIALLAGVTSGAYSSIFTASPVFFDLKRTERRPGAARA